MRSDLQTILNIPPVSAGHELQNKQMVLAWLYMIKFAPNVNFNLPTLTTKIAGLQGVNDQNMIDLQIYGLSRYLGYGNNTWAQLVATARAAINGQGIQQLGVQSQTAVTQADFQTLINYAVLTDTKVLSDAS